PGTETDVDTVTIKLVAVDADVAEGESATYKVQLSDDADKAVTTIKPMTVSFTYSYTTAEGEDITETGSVVVPAGQSEVAVSVATIDDVYAEGVENFTIKIDSVTEQSQFETVSVDTTAIDTSITDNKIPGTETDVDTVTIKLVAVDADVAEGESATYKVQLSDDADKAVTTIKPM
ncbi:MAG: hypothetical protein GY938_17985, partial [Ketobacter sp.]|nr:hypothetical protein [Ketobacter sp.]